MVNVFWGTFGAPTHAAPTGTVQVSGSITGAANSFVPLGSSTVTAVATATVLVPDTETTIRIPTSVTLPTAGAGILSTSVIRYLEVTITPAADATQADTISFMLNEIVVS